MSPLSYHNKNPRDSREQQLLRERGRGCGRKRARESVFHSSRGWYTIFSLPHVSHSFKWSCVCVTPFLGLLSPCPSDTFPISVHTSRCLSLSLCPFFLQFLSLPPSFTLIALVPIHSPLSAAAEGPNWKGGARATQAWKGREEKEGGREGEGQRKPGSVILGTCTGKTKKRKDERDASGKLWMAHEYQSFWIYKEKWERVS